ncbi:hypothetical protein C2G38_2032867 [Gigaspora rosea]|uniref:Uncharacterized protein n=1 Tax=Gigaspora rosea TaxID=44941 RepID=A0A397VND9_9GLOM|nr:hypothetical protein C2G38_2032867 [Gigaspora rosea]
MPCPGSNCVDGITWYSPNFTQPGEFTFCEECYNQFVRITPLIVYMLIFVFHIGNCDFSSNVKQQWLIAVSKNDINIFREYVEPKLGRNKPCPGSNFVDGITFYSPNFTQPGEFTFCEECYNQFVRITPLNVYMRNDGIHNGNCDFSSNVKQQWLIAVSKNDINIFREYVEPKLGRNKPCPGSNFVDGITFYSPNFTQPGEFTLCEECYNQFVRNTPLSVYMQSIESQSGNCDFSSNVKQQWLIAVSRNDINIFKGYVETKLEHIRGLRDRAARLQVSLSQELQRKQFLITSQHNYRIMANIDNISLGGDEPSYEYSFNGSRYNSSSNVEAARIQIQIDESSRIFNNYLAELRLLEHEIANLWY